MSDTMKEAEQVGLHESLKKITKPFHDEIEKCDYPRKLASGLISWNEYKSYLQIMLSIHNKLEASFLGFNQWNDYGIDIWDRCRSKFLERDLIQMGVKELNDISLNYIIIPESFAQAVGALYVLEGSTMGGQFLAKKITSIFQDFPNGTINQYFLSYKEETKTKWQAFCQFLNAFGKANPEAENEVIIAARDTFIFLKKALNDHGN